MSDISTRFNQCVIEAHRSGSKSRSFVLRIRSKVILSCTTTTQQLAYPFIIEYPNEGDHPSSRVQWELVSTPMWRQTVSHVRVDAQVPVHCAHQPDVGLQLGALWDVKPIFGLPERGHVVIDVRHQHRDGHGGALEAVASGNSEVIAGDRLPIKTSDYSQVTCNRRNELINNSHIKSIDSVTFQSTFSLALIADHDRFNIIFTYRKGAEITVHWERECALNYHF